MVHNPLSHHRMVAAGHVEDAGFIHRSHDRDAQDAQCGKAVQVDIWLTLGLKHLVVNQLKVHSFQISGSDVNLHPYSAEEVAEKIEQLVEEHTQDPHGEAEVQADCICIVYPVVCYRGRRCKLTVCV